MNIVIWLVLGAFVGWLAGIVMAREEHIVLDIVVGVIGAVLGGFLFNGPTINDSISLESIIVSFIGAIILLAIVNLVQRGRVR